MIWRSSGFGYWVQIRADESSFWVIGGLSKEAAEMMTGEWWEVDGKNSSDLIHVYQCWGCSANL